MEHSGRPWKALLVELAAFALLIASVASLWRNNLLLLLVTLAECLAALRLWHDRLDLSLLLIIGILGSLAEVVFVWFGVWRYANPTVLGVPVWFPFAFGTTGLIGGRLARTVSAIWEASGSPAPEG